LHDFLSDVRRRTPETSGFLDPSIEPEYGIVTHPNIGHAVRYVARRPVPADNFWAYAGRENWERAFALLNARTEDEALAAAAELRARFVITRAGSSPHTLQGRLHRANGSSYEGAPAFEHFRLVTQARRGSPTLRAMVMAQEETVRLEQPVPYKLFELVIGALIEVQSEPGDVIDLRVPLRTRDDHPFAYVRSATTDESGLATFRVPYASASYRLRSQRQDAHWAARVRNRDVVRGASVRARSVSSPER
jgi:hypothetical protein